jgi:predicted phage terminase large subunit-like protein
MLPAKLGAAPVTLVGLAAANIRRAYDEIAKARAIASLISFVELFWPIIEPRQPFVRGWVQEAIARHLEAVSRGEIDKLLINVPPGFSKSTLVNVFFAAWEWGPGRRPDLRYISWSYAIRLTKRDNGLCRKIIESELYQRLWGQCEPCKARISSAPRCAKCEKEKRFRLDDDQNSIVLYRNDWGGFRFASSIGGGGTGYRADRLIFDDPHSVQTAESDAQRQETIDWFAGTLPSRVRNTDGSVGAKIKLPDWVRRAHNVDEDAEDEQPVKSATIGIMQRVHLRDVSGVILETPALGYQHLLIEMEYAGNEHPARVANDNGRAASPGTAIGYIDPRRALLASVPEDLPGDDALSQIGNVFARIGIDRATLADPVRYPRHEYEKLKHQLLLKSGSNADAAQYKQWPQEDGGDYFPIEIGRKNIISVADLLPAKCGFQTRGWDLAATDSNKAAATCGTKGWIDTKDRVIIRHVAKLRGGPDAVEAFLKTTAKNDGANVRQDLPKDPGAAGKVVAHSYTKLLIGHDVATSPELGSKVIRANPLSAQWKIGNVYLVDDGTWDVKEYLRIMSEFPVGTFKDEVDATVRMLDSQVRAPVVQRPHGGRRVALDEDA